MLLAQNLGQAPRTPYELPWGDARVEGVTLTVRGLLYASPTAVWAAILVQNDKRWKLLVVLQGR